MIDRVLVRVDAQAVTQSLFDRRVRQLEGEAGATPGPATLETKRAAMEQLVNEALLAGRARDLGLTATDAEIDEAVRGLKERNQVASDAEFAAALAESGLTPGLLRDQLRGSLSIQKVVSREVHSRLDLGEEALRRAYERERESWRVPERARVAEILLPTGTAGEAMAREASVKLKGGAPFEEVVKAYSSGPTRGKGGEIGTVARGELSAELDRAVFSLPAGSVTAPIATKSGWHVVKVIERSPARDRPFEEVRGDVLRKERERQVAANLSAYVDRLKRDAVIEVSPAAAAFYTAPAKTPEAPVEMKATPKESAPSPRPAPGKP